MTALTWLDEDDLTFPDTRRALTEPNGLLAVGGDLSINRLVTAYRQGIFPWYDDDQPILWWTPDPRCVFIPERFQPSRSLGKRVRRRDFEIRVDTCFADVLHHCQHRGGSEGTWITADMKEAYLALHVAGFAHSVECWIDNELAGGLYGVSLGRIFFGESMFHHRTDASKIALAGLLMLMRDNQCPLVDCQVPNPHLMSLGAVEIPREAFEPVIQQGCEAPPIAWDSLQGTQVCF